MAGTISTEIDVTLKALRTRGFDARFAPDRQSARELVVRLVKENWIVGCGDSTTIRSLGIIEDLTDLGNRVLNPFFRPKIMRQKPAQLPLSIMKQTASGCDVFLASSNAVTMDGKLVNMDGGGMRVTGMIFGPLMSIIVAGRNKIVQNVDEAIYRVKNVVAPAHARYIGPNWKVPCAATGRCVEPETICLPGKSRICNITVILESKPAVPDTEWVVVLVDDDLGLGWDPAWSQERIDNIYNEYKKFTPPHRPVIK